MNGTKWTKTNTGRYETVVNGTAFVASRQNPRWPSWGWKLSIGGEFILDEIPSLREAKSIAEGWSDDSEEG